MGSGRSCRGATGAGEAAGVRPHKGPAVALRSCDDDDDDDDDEGDDDDDDEEEDDDDDDDDDDDETAVVVLVLLGTAMRMWWMTGAAPCTLSYLFSRCLLLPEVVWRRGQTRYSLEASIG